MTHSIKFSHNWNNKLNNNIFTTIRKHEFSKEKYYNDLVGFPFDILLNGKKINKAILIRVEVKPYKDIDNYLLVLDTGEANFIGIQDIFEKFGMKSIEDNMIILTLKTEEVTS